MSAHGAPVAGATRPPARPRRSGRARAAARRASTCPSLASLVGRGSARRSRATSSAGLRSKKPNGMSVKPVYSTGMTGQSSGRTKCVTPNVYQTTTSVSAIGRSCAVQRGSPSPPACWFGYSPAAAPLVGRVRRDPEVVLREAGAPPDRRVGMREQRRRRHRRHELVGDAADRGRCARSGFAILHVRECAASTSRARVGLGVEPGRALAERVQPRVVGAGRHALGLDLVDLVDRSVDVEVEAGVEQVLVVRRGDAVADHVRELGLRARLDRHRRHDAR